MEGGGLGRVMYYDVLETTLSQGQLRRWLAIHSCVQCYQSTDTRRHTGIQGRHGLIRCYSTSCTGATSLSTPISRYIAWQRRYLRPIIPWMQMSSTKELLSEANVTLQEARSVYPSRVAGARESRDTMSKGKARQTAARTQTSAPDWPTSSLRSVQSPETFWSEYLLALEIMRVPVSIAMDARTAPDAASSNSSYLVYLDWIALV